MGLRMLEASLSALQLQKASPRLTPPPRVSPLEQTFPRQEASGPQPHRDPPWLCRHKQCLTVPQTNNHPPAPSAKHPKKNAETRAAPSHKPSPAEGRGSSVWASGRKRWRATGYL